MNKGLWIKFAAPADQYAGAHRSADGKIVGVLTGAGIDSQTGKPTPARINVVEPKLGENLVVVVNNEAVNCVVDPDSVPWERITDLIDCPKHRVAHLLEAKS